MNNFRQTGRFTRKIYDESTGLHAEETGLVTEFQLVIVPAILVGLFLAGVFLLMLKITRSWVSMNSATKRAAQVPEKLLSQQAMVIQDTIYELEANKLSYTGFPVELKDRLIDAHASWANSPRERKGITR